MSIDSFHDLTKEIKSSYSKELGTGKFIGYPIKEYVTNYHKRKPNYDTGKYMQNEPQNVQRHELKEDYFIQIFIEPKGRNIEVEQWMEDFLMHINEHEAEIVFEDETDDVRIKGVKFYTMNDGRGTIRQIGEIALGRAFKGLSVHN